MPSGRAICIGVISIVSTIACIIATSVGAAALKDLHDKDSAPFPEYEREGIDLDLTDDSTYDQYRYFLGLCPIIAMWFSIAMSFDSPVMAAAGIGALFEWGPETINACRVIDYVYRTNDAAPSNDDMDQLFGGMVVGLLAVTALAVLTSVTAAKASGSSMLEGGALGMLGIILLVTSSLFLFAGSALIWRQNSEDVSLFAIASVGVSYQSLMLIGLSWIGAYCRSPLAAPSGVAAAIGGAIAYGNGINAYAIEHLDKLWPFNVFLSVLDEEAIVGEDEDQMKAAFALSSVGAWIAVVAMALIIGSREHKATGTCVRMGMGICSAVLVVLGAVGCAVALVGADNLDDPNAVDPEDADAWYVLIEDNLKMEYILALPGFLLAAVAIFARSNILATGSVTILAQFLQNSLTRAVEADKRMQLYDDAGYSTTDHEMILGGSILFLLAAAGISALALGSFSRMGENPFSFGCCMLGAILTAVGCVALFAACAILWNFAKENLHSVTDLDDHDEILKGSVAFLFTAVAAILSIVFRNPQAVPAGFALLLAGSSAVAAGNACIAWGKVTEFGDDEEDKVVGAFAAGGIGCVLVMVGLGLGLWDKSMRENAKVVPSVGM